MKKIAFVLIAMIVIVPPALRADTAITLIQYNNFWNNTWTLGFLFTPTVDIYVTNLGSYFPAGALTTHAAGLWDTNGNLIAATNVNGTGIEGFVFSPIAQVELFTGTQYVVGANTRYDDYADGPLPLTALFATSPLITYGGHVETLCFGLAACFPGTAVITAFDDFGANFEFQPVPEPGSMALLGSGLFVLAGAIRRKLSL